MLTRQRHRIRKWWHWRRQAWARILMGWSLRLGGRASFERSIEYYREHPDSPRYWMKVDKAIAVIAQAEERNPFLRAIERDGL